MLAMGAAYIPLKTNAQNFSVGKVDFPREPENFLSTVKTPTVNRVGSINSH